MKEKREMLGKYCSCCGYFVTPQDFCKDSKSPTGLGYWCKTCRSQYQKRYREKKKREKKNEVK